MADVLSGSVIAGLMAGAWRASPPPLAVAADDLIDALPRIVGPGAAALVWRRVAGGPDAADPRFAVLRRAAMLGALTNEGRLARLRPLVRDLQAAGVRPLLFKGQALAGVYPGRNLRPLGDFDLVVRPADRARAVDVLSRDADAGSAPADGQFHYALPHGGGAVVDLHDALPSVYALDLDRLFAEAVPIDIGDGARLLTPRPEHHLRLVAMHMLRHGGWRPLWLVDVAALVEAAGPGFDWTEALGAAPVARAWTATAVGLAADLLGCKPPDGVASPPPRWVVEALLAEWRDPRASRFRSPAVEPSWGFVRRRLAHYWLNPVAAAVALGVAPSVAPPRRAQVAYFAGAVARAALKAASGRGWRS